MKILFLLITFCFSISTFGNSVENYLFKNTDDGMNTLGFLISKNGKVLYEKYKGIKPENKQVLWSMTKTIHSLLFGIAQDKGYINLNDQVTLHLENHKASTTNFKWNQLQKIKVKDVIGMTSGINWREYYEESPFSSNVIRMLYMSSSSRGGVLPYILRIPIDDRKIGTSFYYSSGDSNLLSSLMKNALPQELKDSYPWEFLFKPLNIDATYETDSQGVFLASSYSYMSAYDLLKIGELIVNDGVFQNKRIISQEYIKFLKTPVSALESKACVSKIKMNYGAHVWLNSKCKNGDRPYKGGPENMIMLLGHWGQSVFIFPDQKIVAIRLAKDKTKRAMDRSKYAKLILEAF